MPRYFTDILLFAKDTQLPERKYTAHLKPLISKTVFSAQNLNRSGKGLLNESTIKEFMSLRLQ